MTVTVTATPPLTPDAATPPDVAWTVREAFACAYCWAEFNTPPTDTTPEAYWLSISPRARMDIRRWASIRGIHAVARGEAEIVPAQPGDDLILAVAERAKVKAYRASQIIDAVRMAVLSTRRRNEKQSRDLPTTEAALAKQAQP